MVKGQHWKRLFLLLCGINIVIIAYMLIIINLPTDDVNTSKQATNEEGYVPLHITTNKEDLTSIINHYLQEEVSGPIAYNVVLNNDVVVDGTLPVFNNNVEMKLNFEPKALENGNVELQLTNMSLGKLDLPSSVVLKFVQNSVQTPNWITISPNEENVYLSLDKMKLKSDMKVKVETLNLKDDDIGVALLVPVK